MYRAVAYALLAILLTGFLFNAFAPIGSALDATLNSVARTLRRGADDVAE